MLGLPPVKGDLRIESILDFLKRDPPAAVTAEELAQSVNLSVSRLRHLIKQELGISLGRFLRSKQLEPVKRLLRDSYLSVKQIMKVAGFAEVEESSFVRGFRKICGVTPGEFRRLYRAAERCRRLKKGLPKVAQPEKPMNSDCRL